MSNVTVFVVDTEQTGRSLVHHSMHWFAVMKLTENLDTFFEGKMRPRPKTTFTPKSLALAGGVSWGEIQSWPKPELVMPTFATWLIRHTEPGTTPQFWADNNGHDIKWMNYYMDLYAYDPEAEESLMGHSSRNVNDWHRSFVKGCRAAGHPVPPKYRTRKNLAVTTHNHTPVCDVKGVCESMLAMRDVGLHVPIA